MVDVKTPSLFSAEQGNGNSVVSSRGRVLSTLIAHACEGRVTTYGELAVVIGLPPKGNHMGAVLGNILGDVFRFCQDKGLPYLTSLVVYKTGGDKGLPGGLFWELYDDRPKPALGEGCEYITFNGSGRTIKREVLKVLHKEVFEYFRPLA
jgi:hypothetical protein